MLFFLLRAVSSSRGEEKRRAVDILASTLQPERIPLWSAYLFAILIGITALLLRAVISVSFEERPLLILFTLPIILSALLGGLVTASRDFH